MVEVFDALKAGMKHAVDLTFDVLTPPERLALLQNCPMADTRVSSSPRTSQYRRKLLNVGFPYAEREVHTS
jgi:hypothetical protein